MLPILDIMQKWSSFQATDGFYGWLKVVYKRGWKCTFTQFEFICAPCSWAADMILAACDVEGNFLVVKVSPLPHHFLVLTQNYRPTNTQTFSHACS